MGVSYPKWHFYVLDPKKCSCDPPVKIFLFLHWIPVDHIWIEPWEAFWPPKLFTTLSNLSWNEDQSVNFDLNVNLPYNSHPQKIWNAPLDALMCPLQIINDFEPLSSTLHGVNVFCLHHPSNVKNYLISHKSETGQPKKKKVVLENIFLHLSANFWLKIQNTHHNRNSGTFSTSGQLALNSSANGWVATYSKIQNSLRRAH